MCRTCCGNHFKPLVAPNPVINVNNQITRVQALGFGQKILCLAAFLCRSDKTVTQYVLL